MKKRMLSMAVAAMMLLGSFANVAYAATLEDELLAAPIDLNEIYGADENVLYEGNTPLITAEKILDELNADAASDPAIFDKTQHEAQLAAISGVGDVTTANLDACVALLNDNLTDYKKQYLIALVKAYDENNTALQDELKMYNTSELGLKESFGKLDEYVGHLSGVFDPHGIVPGDYDSYKVRAEEYIKEPLIAIAKILFANNGNYDANGMRANYVNEFLTNDRAKKTLSVLFGADLTEEIVSDSAEGENVKGIVRHVKKYFSENPSEVTALMGDMNDVMVADNTSVGAAFDLLGTYVAASYPAGDLKDDVVMLMGDGTDTGLFELLVTAIDPDGDGASNTWINLFLSEFVQLTLAGGEAKTISAATPTPNKVFITDGSTASFKVKNLSRYGINNAYLNSNYFAFECYNDDGTPNSNVTYNGVNFTVTTDSSKPQTYPAYLTLYRKDATGSVDTFIESYPVTIQNYTPSSGGGGSTRYSVKYETNGGGAISAEYYVKGAKVQLTKVPVREGYIFNGWYSDAALTQRVDSLEMNGNITVYAAWTKDGSSVVSKVDIPELLEGEDHYAYVMGYPEGDIRPMGNITRAETVTMIFRLLKESVRTENMTDENIFSDVNEDDWFNTAVSTLAGLGIVEGRTETEFMPDEYITRAEFATMFARLAQHEYVAENKYGDVDSHWAEEHINEASAYGWIAGYEDDTFRPDKAINRAEAMTLVNRVLKRVPQSKDDLLEGMTIWTDNADTSAWYYLAVQEATNSHEYERKNESYETWTKLTENRDWTTYEK